MPAGEKRAGNAKPVRMALTGRISSGKSTVLSMLADRGAAVLSTDAVVHQLLADEAVRRRVSEGLGLDEIDAGEAGRRQLAALVFRDEDRLQDLQQVLFPLVRERVAAWLDQPEQQEAPLAVVEVPMLLEAEMERMFDYIILITAPREIRRARRARGIEAGDFDRRDAHQLSDGEREPFCHMVFENTGSLEELEGFVDKVYELARGNGD